MTATTRRPPPAWVVALLDLLERGGWQYLQALGLALLATPFFETFDISLAVAAAVATIPAFFSVLLASVGVLQAPAHWPPIGQLVFRCIRAAAAMFLGTLVAAPWVPSLDGVKAILAAAIGAAGIALATAVKGELASLYVGKRGTPSTLSSRYDPASIVETAGEIRGPAALL